MNDDTIQRLRDAYARRILEDLAGLGSLASSDYIRFHALKLLGQHYGLEHVINQLLHLSHRTRSDWIKLQISTLVGTYLQLFTSFDEHENTPYYSAPWPEDPPPPPPLPPEFERELLTGAPCPDEQPPDQPANPHQLNGSRPHPAPEATAETTTAPEFRDTDSQSATPDPQSPSFPPPSENPPHNEIRHSQPLSHHSRPLSRHSRESGNPPRDPFQPPFRQARENGTPFLAPPIAPDHRSASHPQARHSPPRVGIFPGFLQPGEDELIGLPEPPEPDEPFNPWLSTETDEEAKARTTAVFIELIADLKAERSKSITVDQDRSQSITIDQDRSQSITIEQHRTPPTRPDQIETPPPPPRKTPPKPKISKSPPSCAPRHSNSSKKTPTSSPTTTPSPDPAPFPSFPPPFPSFPPPSGNPPRATSKAPHARPVDRVSRDGGFRPGCTGSTSPSSSPSP